MFVDSWYKLKKLWLSEYNSFRFQGNKYLTIKGYDCFTSLSYDFVVMPPSQNFKTVISLCYF